MNIRMRSAPLSLLVVLAGCSGGGGGGSNGTPPPSPPPPPPPAATYSVSAMVSGLKGTLVLQFNDGSDITATADGALTLATALTGGSAYKLVVKTQPASPAQTCTVGNGTGTIATANVSDITVACADVPLTLVSSIPAAGADAVRDAALRLRFSAPLKEAPPAASVQLAGPAGPVTIDLAVANDELVITPASKLVKLANYQLTVGTEIRGSGEQRLDTPLTLAFQGADGTWQAPVRISAAGVASLWPRLTMNAGGEAIAVWEQDFQAVASNYSPGSGWSAGTAIGGSSASHAQSPRVAMDDAGHAVATWSQAPGYVWASVRFEGILGWNWSTSGKIQSGVTAAGNPEVAMNAAGKSRVTWTQNGITTFWFPFYTEYSPADAWTPPGSLQTTILDHAAYSTVACSGNGNGLYVWEQGGTGGNLELWTNYSTDSGGLEGATKIESSSGEPVGGVHVAMDAVGNALVVWTRHEGASDRLRARRYVRGTGWLPTVNINAEGSNAAIPDLAMAANGDAIVVFAQSTGSSSELHSNRLVGGNWSGIETVETHASGGPANPRVALDADGNALAVWELGDGTQMDIWAARRRAQGGWQTPVLIETGSATARFPELAVDGNGDAFALWLQQDPAPVGVMSSRFE